MATIVNRPEELNVSVNKLTSLPRGFGSYNHLKFLDLSSNHLTEITPQIGLLVTLKEIHLRWPLEAVERHSWNELTKIPAEIGRCENLERIVVRWKSVLHLMLVIISWRSYLTNWAGMSIDFELVGYQNWKFWISIPTLSPFCLQMLLTSTTSRKSTSLAILSSSRSTKPQGIPVSFIG